MADDYKPTDYITFRELVLREEELRKQMRAERTEAINGVKSDMTQRFSIFGHEVAKQFVDEREARRREDARTPVPQPVAEEIKSLKQQITDMATGKHGPGLTIIGIGLIILGLGVMAHAPFMKSILPIG